MMKTEIDEPLLVAILRDYFECRGAIVEYIYCGGDHDHCAWAEVRHEGEITLPPAKAPMTTAVRIADLEGALRDLLADCDTLYAMKKCRPSPRMERARELLSVSR